MPRQKLVSIRVDYANNGNEHLEEYLANGWMVLSVTPGSEENYFLVLLQK